MVDDLPRLADWLVVIREYYAGQTYWRVYIRASDQQGLQGKPLKDFPWDFRARYTGVNTSYENGGKKADVIPSGYWLDFTELAEAYGWKRFPAETYWQFSETASRYQYFAYTQGLSLESALLELYPADQVDKLISSPSP
jgi:TolB protein